MDKKYQIFISSTYEDLKKERAEIIRSVLELGHIPVGMEMFSAGDDEQWKVISRTIDAADYYVIVLAHRYGSTSRGVSYTEKEFNYAKSKGIPVLGFVIEEKASWPADMVESDAAKKKKLTAFKAKVKGKMVQFWSNSDDLRAKFSTALVKEIVSSPRTGWIRADEAASPEMANELTRLSKENAVLRADLTAIKKETAEREDATRSVMKILAANTVRFHVRKTVDWTSATIYTKSLAEVFGYIAPNLINENSSLGIAHDLALKHVGPTYHNNWPVGNNQTTEIIADLAALDLVEPSKKKHPVSDQMKYWSLTPLGKKLLKEFRRLRLEEGLGDETAAQVPSVEENGK